MSDIDCLIGYFFAISTASRLDFFWKIKRKRNRKMTATKCQKAIMSCNLE